MLELLSLPGTQTNKSCKWFPIDHAIPTATGISSFTLTLDRASGAKQTVDNNGNSYPVQDAILLQKPQSCVLSSTGALTVTAAVSSSVVWKDDHYSIMIVLTMSRSRSATTATLSP